MSTIVAIRTNIYDDAVAALAARLSMMQPHPVGIIADETHGMVDVPAPYLKASLDAELIGKYNLAFPKDVGWRCGDYFYYAAVEAWSEWDTLWMVEPDVFLNFEDGRNFFHLIDTATTDEFITTNYRRANASWAWHDTMAPVTNDVYGCFFPVTRISRNAAEVLRRKRGEVSRAHGPKGKVPNDEAFVASILTQAGIACSNINDHGQAFYDKDSFSVTNYKSRGALITSAPDNKIYHPVYSGNRLKRYIKASLNKYPSSADFHKVRRMIEDSKDVLSESDYLELCHRIEVELQSGLTAVPRQSVGTVATVVRSSVCHFFIENPKDYIQAYHKNGSFYEEAILNDVMGITTQRGLFVDVGSHTGNHTVFMLKNGGFSHAVLFEPAEELHRGLLLNLSLNALMDRVDLTHVGTALGNRSITARMRYIADNAGRSYVDFSNTGEGTPVPVATGDSVLAGRKVDFIKIDCRGALDVAKGFSGIIGTQSPTVMLTTLFEATKEAIQFFTDHGYQLKHSTKQYDKQDVMIFTHP